MTKEQSRARLRGIVEDCPVVAIEDRYEVVPAEPTLFTGEQVGADALENLLELSLREARKLIECEWNFSDPRSVAAKSGMIQSIFTTATKVDDTQLRRRQVDMLPRLLQLMEQESKKLPPRLIEG